ncbi:BrnA antitoxin family protein [bacterium]|nr:BrnA antitoxin family protein [bacterium]
MAKIPKFKSEKEMQEFWATHDSADYFDDMIDDKVEIDFISKKIGEKFK